MILLKNMLGTIFIISIIFLSLVLGVVVYFNKPKEKINEIFGILTFFIVVWLTSNFLQNANLPEAQASLFLRIDFASGIFLGYFFFLFTILFQEESLISLKGFLKKLLFSLPAILLFFFSFGDLIIKNISFDNNGINFQEGPLFPFYALVLFVYLVAGSVDLISKYTRLKGVKKKQMLHVLLGFSISAAIISINNIFFQQKISVEMFRIGNYGAVFFVFFTSYAILKHHLLKVKVILTESLVVATSLILLLQIFSSRSDFEYAWKSILFILFIVFGVFLIKSVDQEIERRKEIQALYEKVDRLNRVKSEFLSIASHQLRAPLTVTKGYISMIREGDYGKMPKKANEALDRVFKSNERLISMVNEFLDLSRLESGKVDMNFASIPLDELINEIVKELEVNADKKGLYLKTEFPNPLPEIMADRQKLRQVILNILDNAIKYTSKGGVIIKIEKNGPKENIIVSDTGEGMTKEEINNVFEMFTRAKAGMRNHTEGSGIGLYVAKKFIDMHNGSIRIESLGEGKGTTFIIELPILNKNEKDIK